MRLWMSLYRGVRISGKSSEQESKERKVQKMKDQMIRLTNIYCEGGINQ